MNLFLQQINILDSKRSKDVLGFNDYVNFNLFQSTCILVLFTIFYVSHRI